MLNRKKLIQLSISEIPSETEYLDYKQQINLSSEAGRGKLIRLICAMNNSNPNGMSFIFVGIGDDKSFIGAPFLDDADFQNSVKDFIANCPKLSYENITFKELPLDKFIGIITIYPNDVGSYIDKSIWKLNNGDKYIRRGSTTEKYAGKVHIINQNQYESTQLIQRATVSLESTLDTVLSFYNDTQEEYNPQHYVFNDQYVVGISAWKNNHTDFLSEVTVSLINEEVTFFWSAVNSVKITHLSDCIFIEEQALLFWQGERMFMPFKNTKLDFSKVGSYSVDKELLSFIPKLTDEEIRSFLNDYPKKLDANGHYLKILPYELLLAALNGSTAAATLLLDRNNGNVDGSVGESYNDAISTYKQLSAACILS